MMWVSWPGWHAVSGLIFHGLRLGTFTRGLELGVWTSRIAISAIGPCLCHKLPDVCFEATQEKSHQWKSREPNCMLLYARSLKTLHAYCLRCQPNLASLNSEISKFQEINVQGGEEFAMYAKHCTSTLWIKDLCVPYDDCNDLGGVTAFIFLARVSSPYALELEWPCGVHDPCVHVSIGSQSYSSAPVMLPGEMLAPEREASVFCSFWFILPDLEPSIAISTLAKTLPKLQTLTMLQGRSIHKSGRGTLLLTPAANPYV
ncbi:hypothetical protein VNO77_39167 [Canavalia gladiata]|uniref:Uncharacterized protein n=1 Tax=Canavalia gladiata TaxID=3824 RepID=A0AAN9KA00_CANGL